MIWVLPLHDHMAPKVRIMTNLTQTERYTRLINRNKVLLSFPADIEKAYQSDFRGQFIEKNQKLVIFGIFFYMLFFIGDYFFFNSQFVNLTIFRFTIVAISLLLLYHVYIKKNDKHVILVTLLSNLAMGSQLIFGGILFFEQPLDIIYAVGVFPIIVYGIVVFQMRYKETTIVVATLFAGLLLTVVLSRPFDTANNPLLKMMLEFLPLVGIFTATICALGAYTSYSMEKLNRNGWLKNKLLEIDAQDLSKLTGQLRQLSVSDGLTNLYNRRFFDEQLLKLWQKSKANTKPLSLVMLDIDWFKDYNDKYGHGKGDECLKIIAQSLQCNSPSDAVVARYGGEEFVVILPDTHEAQALTTAQQLCDGISDLKLLHENSPFGVCTGSFGVDTRHPAKKGSLTPEEDEQWLRQLLQNVDKALYTAKAGGKNQVSAYARTTSQPLTQATKAKV